MFDHMPERSSNKIASERFIGKIKLSCISETLTVSPDNRRMAYAARVRTWLGEKWCVVIDGTEAKPYDGILKDTLTFSPDSQRVAYAAQVGHKQFVVVHGTEEKPYDGIAGPPIFSSDSQRVAYVARVGDRWFMVVDGKETKPYDGIVRGGRIIFDSADRLHYLALKGADIYLVEERIE